MADLAQNLRADIGSAVEKVGKKLEQEAEKSENTAGMVDADLSEIRSQIGELQRDSLAQTSAVTEHKQQSAKRAHSLEG
eukprot:2951750-Rhodomonas_salina.1